MTSHPKWAVAVLAAGQGTRMKSALPKVLHELAGRPLIDHVLDLACACAPPSEVVVVVGHGADLVTARIAARGVRTALQQPQRGTGDALRVALEALAGSHATALVVLSGDVPLLRAETVARLQAELAGGAAAALLTAELDPPNSYGRVVRGADGEPERVVEARDATPELAAIREVNAGTYALRRAELEAALAELAPDNAQGELYLTDLPAILRTAGHRVAAVRLSDPAEMHGVNSRGELAEAAAILNRRVLARLMADGVTVQDPATTWVDPRCRVHREAILEPGVLLRGSCTVGAGARIGAHAVLSDALVAPGEVVPPLTCRTA